MLKVEQLESREVPASWTSWEGIINPIPGYDGPCMETTGDFDGNGSADTAFVPAEGGGGSIRVLVRSGGMTGVPLVVGSDNLGRIPGLGDTLYDRILNDESFRGGAVISALRAPSGDHAVIAVSPGAGGGPIVNIVDLKEGTEKVQFVLDENYRGGLRFTQLPPLSGQGYPDSLILATPAPGGGGGPVATIFNGAGEILRTFFVGPEDDRSGNYQPIPYGAGTSAPDGSGAFGSYFAAPDIEPYFVDVNGVRREREPGSFLNSDGSVS